MTAGSTPRGDIAALWQRLRLQVTDAALWLELARAYASAGLPWQAGYAARQAWRINPALLGSLNALGIDRWQEASSGDGLLGRVSLAGSRALAQRFAEQFAQCPGDWLTLLYVARLTEVPEPGADLPAQPDHAALQQAQKLEPIAGESLHWMGVWRLSAGQAQAAVAALSGLLDNEPVRYGSMMYLGEALLRLGNSAAAEKAFTRASHSASPDFLLSLALRVYAHNYWQEAIAVLQKAIALAPDSVPCWLALARVQSEVYALSDCRESLRRLQLLEPLNHEARLIHAGLLGRMGDAKGQLESLHNVYEADPLSRLASSMAMTSLYDDEMSPVAVADLHRRLCAPIHAAVPQTSTFRNPRSSDRSLRIGFVSGDFHRQHPVGIFMLPLLERLDHGQFEVFVYHTGAMHDDCTRRAQRATKGWLEAQTLDDAALQQAILADGIDILVDLAGHTSSHRLGVFALRAAPVQATFLGYPHSTGLATMDWLIGDCSVSPMAHAHLFSEGIAQLPGSVFCWAPGEEYPLPAARPAGAATVFGSFNNAMKLSPTTIALWARVLRALPESSLLLKAPSLQDASVRSAFAERFAAHGIVAERLVFRGPTGLADMMQEYGDMDIALDPTPYGGGTTTLQALWMGVPVVTLMGGNFVGRMGASFLRTMGRADCIAEDADQYVSITTRLVQDCGTLRAGRLRLRQQMAASTLCDIAGYVADFQALLVTLWRLHCAGDTRSLVAVPRS